MATKRNMIAAVALLACLPLVYFALFAKGDRNHEMSCLSAEGAIREMLAELVVKLTFGKLSGSEEWKVLNETSILFDILGNHTRPGDYVHFIVDDATSKKIGDNDIRCVIDFRVVIAKNDPGPFRGRVQNRENYLHPVGYRDNIPMEKWPRWVPMPEGGVKSDYCDFAIFVEQSSGRVPFSLEKTDKGEWVVYNVDFRDSVDIVLGISRLVIAERKRKDDYVNTITRGENCEGSFGPLISNENGLIWGPSLIEVPREEGFRIFGKSWW